MADPLRARAPALLGSSRRGDGPLQDRDLNEFVVGRKITRIDAGAITEAGEAVIQISFENGDKLVLAAVVAPPNGYGLRTDFSMAFLTPISRRLYFPGQSHW